MDCDKYLELLALRLDDGLTAEEQKELEEHLTRCPGCRAAGAQLATLQSAFDEWEEAEAPEGFAQGVMERIRRLEKKPVIPLLSAPRSGSWPGWPPVWCWWQGCMEFPGGRSRISGC